MKKIIPCLLLLCVFFFGITYRAQVQKQGVCINAGDYYIASSDNEGNIVYSLGMKNIYLWDYRTKLSLLLHSNFSEGKQIANKYNLSIDNACSFSGYFSYSDKEYSIVDAKDLGFRYYLRLLFNPEKALQEKIDYSDTYFLTICFDSSSITEDRHSVSFVNIFSIAFSKFSSLFSDLTDKIDLN